MGIILLLFIFAVCTGIYLFLTYFKLLLKTFNWRTFTISVVIGLSMLSLIVFLIITSEKGNNSWCESSHITNNYPPTETVTAMDFFEKGNYEYDLGNCDQALADYTTSIELNPDYPQSYNNRAYTLMRMERYDEALMDLDKALTLKSNYLNALMNRADVYNYHKVDKEKALVDYNKIIELQGEGGRAVCSHMVDAKYPKFSLAKVLAIPSMIMGCGK